jgi:predicted ATPase
VTLFTLNRLSPRQRAEMIALVTFGKRLPKEIADQIVERTDGVPLFIEELTKSVVESGLVTEAGDHYAVVGSAKTLAIPTSLHASLLARLDRLAPTREVAQIGAALGRSFSHELISAVAQMPQRKLDEALDQLVGAELVFRRGTPPYAEYTFKHALVQDAAYSTLLRTRRQQIHGLIVSTLETQFPEIVASQPQLLAQHCADAGLNEKSVGYRLKAGQQSVARSEMPEAVEQLRKGLELLLSLPDSAWRQQQELDLRIALGPPLMAIEGYAAADVADTVRRARELATQLNRPDYLVELLYGQWGIHLVGSEHLAALACGEEMEQIGRQEQNTVVTLMARLYQAIARWSLGELTTAFNLLKECLQLKDPAYRAASAALTPEDPYLMTLSWIAVTSAALGYIEQARGHISEALSVIAQLERAERQAYSHCFLLIFACGTEWTAGSADGVRQHSNRLVSLADEHGFPYMWTAGLLYSGWAAIALGDPNKGLGLIEKGLATNRVIGSAWGTAWYLIWQADARSKLGQHDLALELLAQAEALMVKTGERFMEGQLFLSRGVLASNLGDAVAAELFFQRALDISKRQAERINQLRAAMAMARLWREHGKRVEARDLLAPVYGWFTEGFDAPVLKEAKVLLDELQS